MPIWEVLGIEATTDLSVIKRAYSQKLLQTHPQDKPREFQQLKEAFEAARGIAKQKRVSCKPSDDVELVEPIFLKEEIDFMERVNELYQNISKRFIYKNWEMLFEETYSWSIEEYNENNESLIYFLKSKFETLPKSIVLLFLETFQFSSDSLQALADIPDFSFECCEQIEKENVDRFLRLRYNLYDLLRSNFFEQAKVCLKALKQIHSEDTDTLTLTAMYHFNRNMIEFQEGALSFERTIRILERAVEQNRNNKAASFYLILMRARNSRFLSEYDIEFLENNEYGYAIHSDFFRGYAFYFARELELAVKSWERLNDLWLRVAEDEYYDCLTKRIQELRRRPNGSSIEIKQLKIKRKYLRSLRPKPTFFSKYSFIIGVIGFILFCLLFGDW